MKGNTGSERRRGGRGCSLLRRDFRGRRRLRRGLLFGVCVCLCAGLLSCAGGGTSDASLLGYAAGGVTAHVEGTFCRHAPDGYKGPAGLPGEGRTDVPWAFAADVTITPRDENGVRGVSLTYTSPPSLAGLQVRSTGEGTEISLDGLTFSDASGAYDGLLLPALALIPDGDLCGAVTDASGARVLTLSHLPEGGSGEEITERVLTFTSASLPDTLRALTETRVVELHVKGTGAP